MTSPVIKENPAVADLPLTYVIELSELSAISITGNDKRKYLQGQVTCDVDTLAEQSILCGAHCNAKGKVFSCFRLFNYHNSYLLFQHKSTIEPSVSELKKFAVFADVDIENVDHLAFYALVGEQAKQLIQQKFNQVPDSVSPIQHNEAVTVVYLPGLVERYLLIFNKELSEALMAYFNLPTFSSAVWDLLEIQQGFPLLKQHSVTEYVPQMLNLQAIDGISFTKGCYLGQETVARMQYLGKNKKALFSLSANDCEITSAPIIEKQLGENWRKAGDVISFYQSHNNNVLIQAVLAKDTDESTPLRIQGKPNCNLLVNQLPYSLTEA
jgi:hypothetical protein